METADLLLAGTPNLHIDRLLSLLTTHYARVFEGVATSHFLLKAVIFKSQKRVMTRFGVNLPPPTLWCGTGPGPLYI